MTLYRKPTAAGKHPEWRAYMENSGAGPVGVAPQRWTRCNQCRFTFTDDAPGRTALLAHKREVHGQDVPRW